MPRRWSWPSWTCCAPWSGSELPRHRRAGGLRGRTRPGRLTTWTELGLALLGPQLRARPDAPVVDVGIGDSAPTVRELVLALRAAGHANPVVAVDADRARVERAAAELADLPAVTVAQADLRVLDRVVHGAAWVRVANVVRQCAPAEVPALHRALTASLGPGGRAFEGSSDREGTVSSFHVLGPGGRRHALAFATTLAGGFAPVRFRDHLPRDLRRRARDLPALEGLFQRWTAAFEAARASGVSAPAALFRASVADTPDLRLHAFAPARLGACWHPPGGTPLAPLET